MNIDAYIKDALRSEKPLLQVRSNSAFLHMVLELLVQAGTIADMLKKEVVYGKPHDPEAWRSAVEAIGWDVVHLSNTLGGAAKVTNELVPIHPRLLHAALGVTGESAELLEEMLDASADNRPLDYVNAAEEAGDTMWYLALWLDALRDAGVAPDAVLTANIDKLKVRYPEKFSLAASEQRDTVAEREQLERSVA